MEWFNKLTGVVMLAVSTCSTTLFAADSEYPNYLLNGFGTLGLVHSSESRADFSSGNYQPTGAGFTRSWSPDVDSRLGLQIFAALTPKLDAVLQVVTEQQWDDSYRPTIEWANIRYELNPEIKMRIGRIAMPSYLSSNSRKVGFSYPLLRPPIEVYRLMPISNSDGIDINYRVASGDVCHSLTVLFGSNRQTNTRGQVIHSSDVAGLFYTFDYGPFAVHLAHQTREASTLTPPLTRFTSVGASYDEGQWFAMAEWGQASVYSPANTLDVRQGWFASAGYRLGDFTPLSHMVNA